MGQAFAGATGTGSVVVYTVPRGFSLRLEILRFVLTCDGTAGIHKARVVFYDSTLSATTATLRDLNEAGPSEVVTYTYGIGLNGTWCVAISGWEVTDALPNTELAPQTTITIAGVTDAGVVIAGDAISAVVLFGELLDLTDATGSTQPVQLLAGLLPGAV